ncbi:TIGR01244 family sulfur transferase [Paucibacter sp. PLA-PC-4]|uniref:TIGR01244 family sulfur transferase n=1 Tax=Paucibacter sp. PLA-PC-4 TaxID=2993655 RepID=UPI00224983A4|nr:TIGR01244 family sulfur transferase [Paucibacter sp. PLA-PC-4]MCX2861861.1 TIGR01244 family sulfur transferase [Paucibacter sp. PLA-PC-4]
MSLPTQALSPDFCVAPQLEPAAMVEAAAAGFRSVINNRPDFEGGPDQPTSAQVEAAARAAGLEYRHLPVSGAYQSPQEIEQFKQLIDSLPRPILAFCRSGARSSKLYTAARQGY